MKFEVMFMMYLHTLFNLFCTLVTFLVWHGPCTYSWM